jgi:hypothetical protein
MDLEAVMYKAFYPKATSLPMLNVQRSPEIWFANRPGTLNSEWGQFRILGVERSWRSGLL